MQVLIPHPTELIFLTRLQKEIIKNNYNSECLLTRILPLWIELPFITEKNLKETAKKISKIEIFPPEVSHASDFIFCPTKLIYDGTEFHSKINLIKIHKPKSFILKKISTEEINFPLCLKIFRIGNKIELPEQNAQAIQDSVWKKL